MESEFLSMQGRTHLMVVLHMTTTQACSQYQFTNNMLKKEDYVYFKPDTEFVYYGAPMPVLDN